MAVCVQVYVRQGTCVLCMYVYRYLGGVCGSYALGFAPGGSCEGVNKENEEVLSIDNAVLVPFDSNWFMWFVLCPWAMLFFQKLCPAPFPPVT